MYKFLTKLILIICIFLSSCNAYAKLVNAPTFVSLTPVTTEIMYAIGAQNSLIGISTRCNYPAETKNKEKVGDNFFLNKEKIIRLNPDYILAIDSSQPILNDFSKTGIKPIFFKFNNIESIYKNILEIGKLTNKEKNAHLLVKNINAKINLYKAPHPKKILYLIQPEPMITIGNKSFITSVIKKSGHICVTDQLKSDYPIISKEYAIKTKPDIIIVTFKTDITPIKKLFPDSKIIFLTKTQRDILNRPGPRVYEGVRFFSEL